MKNYIFKSDHSGKFCFSTVKSGGYESCESVCSAVSNDSLTFSPNDLKELKDLSNQSNLEVHLLFSNKKISNYLKGDPKVDSLKCDEDLLNFQEEYNTVKKVMFDQKKEDPMDVCEDFSPQDNIFNSIRNPDELDMLPETFPFTEAFIVNNQSTTPTEFVYNDGLTIKFMEKKYVTHQIYECIKSVVSSKYNKTYFDNEYSNATHIAVAESNDVIVGLAMVDFEQNRNVNQILMMMAQIKKEICIKKCLIQEISMQMKIFSKLIIFSDEDTEYLGFTKERFPNVRQLEKRGFCVPFYEKNGVTRYYPMYTKNV